MVVHMLDICFTSIRTSWTYITIRDLPPWLQKNVFAPASPGANPILPNSLVTFTYVFYVHMFFRTARNFFLQHPVIPRKFRNSLAAEHLGQHAVLDGDSVALHIQVPVRDIPKTLSGSSSRVLPLSQYAFFCDSPAGCKVHDAV